VTATNSWPEFPSRKGSKVVRGVLVSRATLFEEGDPPPFFDLQGGMKELLDSPPAFRLQARPRWIRYRDYNLS
jgi:hypothetical protein